MIVALVFKLARRIFLRLHTWAQLKCARWLSSPVEFCVGGNPPYTFISSLNIIIYLKGFYMRTFSVTIPCSWYSGARSNSLWDPTKLIKTITSSHQSKIILYFFFLTSVFRFQEKYLSFTADMHRVQTEMSWRTRKILMCASNTTEQSFNLP